MNLNTIYNENNLETMKRMPDNFIDLTVTSPPYDGIRQYKNNIRFEFMWKETIHELFRVTKQGGVLVWVVADQTVNGSETGTSFEQALFAKMCGFNLHDTMIYKKENFIPLTHNRYEPEFEYMFVFSKGKPKTFNPILIDCIHAGKTIKRSRNENETGIGLRKEQYALKTKEKKQKGNIWAYKTGGGNTVNHIAQFPEQLVNDHIITWSNEGDIVYDCFMGSGTTAKMAVINKRKWIGSEISAEYCGIAHERLKQFDNDIFLNSFEKTEERGQKIK